MALLCPYIHLNGTTREAMEFYKEIFGGELELMTVGQSDMLDKWPADMPKPDLEKIMHSTLRTDKWTLMASDMMDPSSFTVGDNIDICIVCESKEEIETLYNKLKEGAKEVFQELAEMPFGWFASVTDKFGTNWMLQFDGK